MKILSNLKLTKLIENIKRVSERFSVSVAVIIIGVILMLCMLHWDFKDSTMDGLWKATISIIITFFLSVWVYLTSESKKANLHKNVYQIAPLIFWVLFYFGFSSDIDNFENFVFFFLTLAWIIWYLFFAPYLDSKVIPFLKKTSWKTEGLLDIKQTVFYSYFYNISVVFLMSFILWGVLFALWSIWITAVEALFDLRIDSEYTYGNWAIISLALITPIFSLSQIPLEKSITKNDFTENMFFSFLIKFVAIPFIVIYFLILYAYTIKVLANFWDWPKGEVSWMVIWFSIFGYITYVFSYIFEKKNSFIKKFRTVFPYVVVPQIFMLFYAIYLRLNQYDLTINRYFVVVFGLWLLCISLYYILSSKKKLILIPAILTLFTIIISIWPWWVYSLSESRQFDRLEKNLREAHILLPTTSTPPWEYIKPLTDDSDISQELSKDIYSWIDYMCDFDSCNSIKKRFRKIYEDLYIEDQKEWNKRRLEDIERMESRVHFTEYNTKEDNAKSIEEKKNEIYKWPNKWIIVTKITEKIKVKNYFSDKWDIPSSLYFNLKSKEQNIYPIEIENYDYIATIVWVKSWSSNEWVDDFKYIELDIDNKNIILKKGENILETTSIDSIYDSLIELNKTQPQDRNYNGQYNKEDLTFLVNWTKNDYKIIFQHITIPNPAYIEMNAKPDDVELQDIKRITSDFYTWWNWLVLINEK